MKILITGGAGFVGSHAAEYFARKGNEVVCYDNLSRGELLRKDSTQLTWLANRNILNLPEDRRHGRFIPRKTMARLILPNGNNVACRVIDLSESGAAISISPELRPAVGSMVTIGKTTGRVVRHIEDGFAVEFTRLQHHDFIEENVTGG